MLLPPIWPLLDAPSRKNSAEESRLPLIDHCGDRAVIERALPDGRAVERDAGHHGAEHERVARVERHFRDLLRGDDAAAAGALRFEHRRFGGDFHRVGDGADFQSDVDTGDLGGFERHVVADELLESLRRRRQLVNAGAEQRDRIRAGIVVVAVVVSLVATLTT